MRFLAGCFVIAMAVFCCWVTWEASTMPIEQEAEPTRVESLETFFGIE